MTQSNRQAPVLKYSGESNDHVSPQEYKIRVGKAVRTLREELPQFFQYGLCTTSIYASNIRLIEASHTNATIQGKPIYFLLAGAVRWSFKIWFRDLEFEIQSIRVNDRGGRGLKGMDSGGDYANATASILKYHSSAGTQPSSATRPGTFDHCMVESPLDFTYRHYPERGSRAFEMDCVDKLDRTTDRKLEKRYSINQLQQQQQFLMFMFQDQASSTLNSTSSSRATTSAPRSVKEHGVSGASYPGLAYYSYLLNILKTKQKCKSLTISSTGIWTGRAFSSNRTNTRTADFTSRGGTTYVDITPASIGLTEESSTQLRFRIGSPRFEAMDILSGS
ncbi:hypothetical protein BC939DRAFT_480063 [Gamsiella multidivaricata]|uniref:uncharacterized protein n=1 Tax=Gamsiella multidivaricata TaxID=101098 RepID=UPI00221F1C7B|nr:uncharacterized protein BC939DRAFT_480063 [Gamsiella multidivaricata]KAI7818893.1 hypothetical protein BC939DRAFT_480063 [Gamsiella multidivaricata]